MNFKPLLDIFDDKDKLRAKKMFPAAVFIAAALAVVFFLPQVVHLLFKVLALEVAETGRDILHWFLAVLFSAYGTRLLMSYLTGRYAEDATPLASVFTQMEAQFDKEFKDNPTWTDAHLRFADSCSRVIFARTILTGIVFFVMVLFFALLFSSR